MITTAIALLTYRPDARQVAFYETMISAGYHVYVFVDDQDFAIPASARAQFVKIDDLACMAKGYAALNPLITHKKRLPVSAWEKALLFFCQLERRHAHVWFLEDDVFVPAVQTVTRIDADHPSADLLCKKNRLNLSGEMTTWPWWKLVPSDILPLPWASSMVCAVRMSRPLLSHIDRFLTAHAGHMAERAIIARNMNAQRKYLFIEFLFNTLALHAKLNVERPSGLGTIGWRAVWSREMISQGHIYHPVKDLDLQDSWRRSLNSPV